MECFWTTLPPVWSECACSSDYLSLNTIVLSSLIHHLIIFHCPLADLNTACFSFSGSTVFPLITPLFKECRQVSMLFLSRILLTRSMLFLFHNLSYSGINSHISKIMSIQSLIVEMKSERYQFLKVFLKFKLLWSKTQHMSFNTCSLLIILYFEKQKLTRWKIKMAFSMVLRVNFNVWSWVYLLMICDEVTFLWISKTRCLLLPNFWPTYLIKFLKNPKIVKNNENPKTICFLIYLYRF
jgi:hypothetical protein